MKEIFDMTSNHIDRPVKLYFKNKIKESKVEIYKLTLKEVLLEILKYNYDLRMKLTKQQIHSERGKLKHGNYKEVVNFLVKRGITKNYINTELNIERERIVYIIPLFDIIGTATNTKFGIINIE